MTDSRTSDTLSDREIVAEIAAALNQGELAISAPDAVALSKAAVEYANEKAKTDPKLGLGRDVRAIFAHAEGIVLGALAWRDAERRASQ